ncbi:MAG: sodium:solute symporter family protein [Leptospiraceae bacterium]|nr:sodium:solute symporter family protein [Leptospiraceae bacterium]
MLGIAILGYLTVTITIGAFASKFVKSSNDYVLAGRRLPMMLATSALFATWFGSETILGSSTRFVEHGILGVIEEPFGAALCLILIGLFFARPLYRLNLITLSDFFRNRFDRRTEILASLFLIPSYFGWIAAQLIALQVILESVTGWGSLTCLAAGTASVVFYTYVGGMWAISITDFMQTIVIVLGLGYFAWYFSNEAGGIESVISTTGQGFFRFYPKAESKEILSYISAWMIIGLGSIPQQDIFQRVNSARSETVAVRSSLIAGFAYLTIAMLPLFTVLAARAAYPDLSGLADKQQTLPQAVLLHGGLAIQIIFFGALTSAILSTASGAILAPATVLGENLIRPLLKNVDDKRMLKIYRYSVLSVAFASVIFALLGESIFELVSQSSALSLVSLFIPLTFGLFTKWANSRGVAFAATSGMVVWLYFDFVNPDVIPAVIPALLCSFLGLLIGSFFQKKTKSVAMH